MDERYQPPQSDVQEDAPPPVHVALAPLYGAAALLVDIVGSYIARILLQSLYLSLPESWISSPPSWLLTGYEWTNWVIGAVMSMFAAFVAAALATGREWAAAGVLFTLALGYHLLEDDFGATIIPFYLAFYGLGVLLQQRRLPRPALRPWRQ